MVRHVRLRSPGRTGANIERVSICAADRARHFCAVAHTKRDGKNLTCCANCIRRPLCRSAPRTRTEFGRNRLRVRVRSPRGAVEAAVFVTPGLYRPGYSCNALRRNQQLTLWHLIHIRVRPSYNRARDAGKREVMSLFGHGGQKRTSRCATPPVLRRNYRGFADGYDIRCTGESCCWSRRMNSIDCFTKTLHAWLHLRC